MGDAQTNGEAAGMIEATEPASASLAVLAAGRARAIVVRAGTLDDLAWIDACQKRESKALGFLPRKALEGKIKLGQVIVAETAGAGPSSARSDAAASEIARDAGDRPGDGPAPVRLGYLMAADRYFRRDDVGYITQMYVVPEARRGLVAGQLLEAQFERSAWGCKLYACWCAQDLKANAFWEAMGFTAIAYRTGSTKKGSRRVGTAHRDGEAVGGAHPTAERSGGRAGRGAYPTARMHIFWQKRIRAGDTTTPFWFPSVTTGGAMRADRVALPIMPGQGWERVLPVVLPAEASNVESGLLNVGDAIVGCGLSKVGETRAIVSVSRQSTIDNPRSSASPVLIDNMTLAERIAALPVLPMGPWGKKLAAGRKKDVLALTAMYAKLEAERAAAAAKVKATQRKAIKTEKATASPRLVSFAREVRDRWMEGQEFAGRSAVPLGKYDVRRPRIGHGPERRATGSGAMPGLVDIVEGEVVAA